MNNNNNCGLQNKPDLAILGMIAFGVNRRLD